MHKSRAPKKVPLVPDAFATMTKLQSFVADQTDINSEADYTEHEGGTHEASATDGKDVVLKGTQTDFRTKRCDKNR